MTLDRDSDGVARSRIGRRGSHLVCGSIASSSVIGKGPESNDSQRGVVGSSTSAPHNETGGTAGDWNAVDFVG